MVKIRKEFEKFGRKSKQKSLSSNRHKNATNYLRVSTSEQTNNFSIETQRDNCRRCAETHNLKIIAEFGGTFESAKSDDDRKEFNKMLSFVKNPKNEIGYVIVSDFDRFSRTGVSAIMIREELKKFGVLVIEAGTNSLDYDISEETMASFKMIMANTENQLRKKKCVEGSIKRLEAGYWCGQPTKGYRAVDKTTLELTEEAKHIKQAFEMKADGFSNTDIIKAICSKGSTITRSALPRYLANPFYCGLLANKHLNGEVTKGKHPPIVSQKLFLRANKIFSEPKHYKTLNESNERPLQRDIHCSCGGVFTGYMKKKKYHYYKCNKCGFNSSVKPMHNLFIDLLDEHSFNINYLELFKLQLKNTFKYIESGNISKRKDLRERLTKKKKNLRKVTMRFALDEIPKDIFESASQELESNIDLLKSQESDITFNLSNYEDYVNHSLDIVSNIKQLWIEGNGSIKRDVQNIMFSNHLIFDKEKRIYRTPNVNKVISLFTVVKKEKKASQNDNNTVLSRFVLKVEVALLNSSPHARFDKIANPLL
jgi:DNA invertase Pin-like site-specific DNA recombinase